MHIEKCSIETTETRTRAGWMKPDDVALGIGPYYVREAGVVGHDIPVTLTYPAPVQVDGFRLECSFDEAAPGAILAAIEQIMHENGRTICGRWVAVDDSASPPTQPSGESTIGDRLIAGLEGFRDKLKSGEPIEAVTYTTPPAPKDAGKRGDEAEMRRRGWEWDSQLRGWTKAIREHKYIVWYDYSDSTWNANDGIENIDSYPTQLAAVDACETYTPESTHPAPLPWHDLGPGLSVAVVEGRGVYVARQHLGDYIAYQMNHDGDVTGIRCLNDSLAAAKAACDAHHAKGGA